MKPPIKSFQTWGMFKVPSPFDRSCGPIPMKCIMHLQDDFDEHVCIYIMMHICVYDVVYSIMHFDVACIELY